MNVAELTFDSAFQVPERQTSSRHRTSPQGGRRPGASRTRGEDRNGRPVAGYTQVLIRTAVLLTIAIASLVLIFSSGVEADNAPHTVVSHVIQPGDTLWSLAGRYTPEGGDVRATISAIRQANGFDGSTLPAGAAIQIPTG